MRARPYRSSEGQRKFGSVRRKHAAEFGLNAFESCFVVGFKAEHNDRCRIRGTRKAEAVGMCHAPAVDTDYLGSARKFGRCREPRDQRMRRLAAAGDRELRCGDAVGQRMQCGGWVGMTREDLEQPRARVQAVVEAVPAFLE